MSHMEKQVEFGEWIQIDGPCGTEIIHADLVGEVRECSNTHISVPEALQPYCENTRAWSIKKISGWGSRFSAPGFLDATPWVVFKTEKEAAEYLDEQDENDDDDE